MFGRMDYSGSTAKPPVAARKIKGDSIEPDGSTGVFKGKRDPDCASKL